MKSVIKKEIRTYHSEGNSMKRYPLVHQKNIQISLELIDKYKRGKIVKIDEPKE
jgi:hypothetical protein